MTLGEKLKNLREIVAGTGGAVVAFSGGVDSTFLAKVARNVLGDKALAVTVRSRIHPRFEAREAEELARAMGIRHVMLDADPLDVPGFAANPPERCYICKREILAALWEVARGEGVAAVMEGTNADDSGDYRPGMRAVAEAKALSPLKEAGLTKRDIRELSCRLGLPTWDKPSYACLASRIPYGEAITEESLRAIEAAEGMLREKGYKVFRVRKHGDIARIELSAGEMKRFIAEEDLPGVAREMKALGFKYVALDMEGYRTGSLNEALPSQR